MQIASGTPTRMRTLGIGGKLPSIASLCGPLAHIGPLENTDRFTAAGEMWAGMGNCSCCGSTINESQIIRGAA